MSNQVILNPQSFMPQSNRLRRHDQGLALGHLFIVLICPGQGQSHPLAGFQLRMWVTLGREEPQSPQTANCFCTVEQQRELNQVQQLLAIHVVRCLTSHHPYTNKNSVHLHLSHQSSIDLTCSTVNQARSGWNAPSHRQWVGSWIDAPGMHPHRTLTRRAISRTEKQG